MLNEEFLESLAVWEVPPCAMQSCGQLDLDGVSAECRIELSQSEATTKLGQDVDYLVQVKFVLNAGTSVPWMVGIRRVVSSAPEAFALCAVRRNDAGYNWMDFDQRPQVATASSEYISTTPLPSSLVLQFWSENEQHYCSVSDGAAFSYSFSPKESAPSQSAPGTIHVFSGDSTVSLQSVRVFDVNSEI